EGRELVAEIAQVEPPTGPPALLVVILFEIYKFFRLGCRWSIKPPARANCFGCPRTFSTKSSPWKRWIHRSQWASIPKYPSQTATKTATCEMELGPKLCSSAP